MSPQRIGNWLQICSVCGDILNAWLWWIGVYAFIDERLLFEVMPRANGKAAGHSSKPSLLKQSSLSALYQLLIDSSSSPCRLTNPAYRHPSTGTWDTTGQWTCAHQGQGMGTGRNVSIEDPHSMSNRWGSSKASKQTQWLKLWYSKIHAVGQPGLSSYFNPSPDFPSLLTIASSLSKVNIPNN